MPCMVSGREIILSGDVGSPGDWWFGEDVGILSSEVIIALAQIGPGPVTIRINSGGGIAWEGSAIHAAVARHDGEVTVIVEGVAASAASIIAMAGEVVVMAPGALMMVHEAAGLTIGDAREHQRALNCLGALNDAMAGIYAGKTGRPVADCRAEMAAETWMTPEQAVELGYADRVEGSSDTADAEAAPTAPAEPAPFPYRAYRNAPAPILALADRKDWPRRLPQAAAPVPPASQERGMPKPKAEAAPAEPGAPPAPALAPAEPANPEPAGDPPPAPEDPVPEPVFSRADAAEIIDICTAGGAPTMASALVREGVSAETARKRVDAAGRIKDVVALARQSAPHLDADFADKAIVAGQTVDQVKASLFDAMAARSEAPEAQVDHRKRTGAGGSDHNAGDGDSRAKSTGNMRAKVARKFGKKEG